MRNEVLQRFMFQLENVFCKHIGVRDGLNCFQRLERSVTSKPMILIAGDQLTGKSTLAVNLAKHLHGNCWSVGMAFRAVAASRGISPAELSEQLLKNDETGIDIEIDFRTCELIGGEALAGDIGVIEGRQPAFMGLYMREAFRKPNIVSIYLECNMRERALRFLLREFGTDAHRLGSERLPPIEQLQQRTTISVTNNTTTAANSTSTTSARTTAPTADAEGDQSYDETASIAAYGRYIAQLPLADVDRVARAFVDNQYRDQHDVDRYRRTYGIDYRDRSAYDIVIDMSNRSAKENFQFCLDQLIALDVGLPKLIRERLKRGN